jgi:hydroxypyruvate isomerase
MKFSTLTRRENLRQAEFSVAPGDTAAGCMHKLMRVEMQSYARESINRAQLKAQMMLAIMAGGAEESAAGKIAWLKVVRQIAAVVRRGEAESQALENADRERIKIEFDQALAQARKELSATWTQDPVPVLVRMRRWWGNRAAPRVLLEHTKH